MHIGILLETRDYQRESPNIAGMIQLLSERGLTLDLIYPEKQMIHLANVQVKNDLYLIKSGTDLSMSLAGTLHALGAVTINPYPTVAMLQNKVIITRILQQAGVPTPETYITQHPQDLAPLLDAGSLIVKPHKGFRGQGIRVLSHIAELEEMPHEGLIFAQRFHQSAGLYHSIYRIGDQLFGVKRIWPSRTIADRFGEPFAPSPELRDIALKVGQAFGIYLYGMDVVISDGQPYVVDVNKFGSFLGVPDAPRHLADYICAAVQRAGRGEF